MTTQDIIQKDLLWINQSKVKRLTEPAQCPHRYYLEEISGEYRRGTTDSMMKGHYFEYKLWGTLPKEGNVPVLKGGRKKGSISADQERIDEQVAIFPYLMEKYGIKVIQTNYKIEVKFNNDIFVFGTQDALVEYKGKPYVFDLKLTKDVTSTYGDFAWGNFKTIQSHVPGTDLVVYTDLQTVDYNGTEMDLIQAHAYSYFMELKTRRRWGFLYGVFDYKASRREHKIIEVPYRQDAREDMIQRFGDTKHKLQKFAEMGYAPIPSEKQCKTCPFTACTSRITVDELPLPEGISQSTSPVQASILEDPDASPF